MLTNRIASILFWVFSVTALQGSAAVVFGSSVPPIPSADSLDVNDSAIIYTQLWSDVRDARANKNLKKMAAGYTALGEYHRNHGHIDSALVCLERARAVYEALGDKPELAKTSLALAEVYSLKTEYLDAMNATYKALEIYETQHNEKGIAECYSTISNLLYYSERNEESIEYCIKAIAIQEKLGLKRDLAGSYYAKACSELFIYDGMESALTSINKSLELYNQLQESGYDYMKALNWRGNVLKYMGRYAEALTDYENNLKNARARQVNHYILASLANIGHVYLLNAEYAKALPYHLEAIALMKKAGDTNNLWENYMHVAEAYEHLNQPDSALRYQKLYTENYTDYFKSIIARLETEAGVKYETRKKNETINAQATMLAAQEKLKKVYFGGAFLLLIILALLLYGYYRRRQRNRKLALLNVKLDRKNRQNELLMKEIHHRVKNNLEMVKSLLALQSEKLKDPASREAILAGQSRVQSMGIIHQKLYLGNTLDSIEMKDYFENLGQDILDSYQAADRIAISCPMPPIHLNVDTALPIGLIANELISNSLKYAFPDHRTGEIQINLTQKPDGIHLKIADDGVGYELNSTPRGTGFGSELIDLLTRQLNGVICKENEHGTTLLFHFHPTKAA